MAKQEIFALRDFFVGEDSAAAEAQLIEILELLLVVIIEAIFAQLHSVLQLNVATGFKLESAVDAIVHKETHDFLLVLEMPASHLDDDWRVFAEEVG